MLAKVIRQQKTYTSATAVVDYITSPDENRARALGEGLSGDARYLIEYAARAGVVEAGVSDALRARGIENPLAQQREIARAFDEVVQRVRASGVDAKEPLYHVVVTWQPGETPSVEHARAAVAHTLSALGMGEAAATWVIHRDKAHHHVHVVALKYHPETLKYLGPPHRDFFVLDKAMREIELAQGWAHSPGPHIVREGRVVRRDGERGRAAGPEAGVEKAHGLPGIATFARATGLTEKLLAAQDWQQLHAVAAAAGLRIEQKRAGLVLKADGISARHALKASALHRQLAYSKLAARLGPFQPPAPSLPPLPPALAPAMPIQDYQAKVARGEEPLAHENPGRTGGSKRDEQRQARTRAREALYEAFREEKRGRGEKRKAALQALRKRQREEAAQVAMEALAEKKRAFAELAGIHGAAVAQAMAEGRYAQAIAALREKHAAERASVKRYYDGSWRGFLEARAREGDPAAISALRGIRYREKRKQREAGKAPGFEGEDLRVEAPDTPGFVGGIEGEERRFSLSSARIELSDDNTTVLYKDSADRVRMTDSGPFVELARADDNEAMIAALELAAQRYGGEVFITGDEAFRKRAAIAAAQRGIRVANLELQHIVAEYERERERGQRQEQKQRPRKPGREQAGGEIER